MDMENDRVNQREIYPIHYGLEKSHFISRDIIGGAGLRVEVHDENFVDSVDLEGQHVERDFFPLHQFKAFQNIGVCFNVTQRIVLKMVERMMDQFGERFHNDSIIKILKRENESVSV